MSDPGTITVRTRRPRRLRTVLATAAAVVAGGLVTLSYAR